MAEHPNVARIKDLYAAFATGDFAVLNDTFTEELVWHEGGRNQLRLAIITWIERTYHRRRSQRRLDRPHTHRILDNQ